MEFKKPLIIYHRGRHGKSIRVKENTLEAFERAIKEGAAMVEFDVWGDGHVQHDHASDPLAPTLWGVMDAIRARIAVNIEIKSPEAVSGVLEVVEEALSLGPWAANQIVVSSFHHESAIRVKSVFPELRVGVINDGVLEPSCIKWLASKGVDNLHVAWMNIIMDIDGECVMRRAVQANNMHIWVWIVNTKKVFDTVVAYGAEAIFTDKPQLFR
ncbi:MAG: hypothetical protein A3D65_01820 [Candidatus Lloydbacteria bacterium RIFCSPHIGHO2_02_FULL_50_13]|uniref:GP-PDE domain-containing protein n=1 Tax=Candidatus Lloydbacteria bacterium RIFCSPHIGHO2_02_FULL_50_13 TaxID=1798661 RepID=A0A1G2D0U1_9BACT|nr:MAG: hypothetical protein A3D65_01820 [Candidatus Lloydbacteria bacterium RIFCSPHIGHO2_02_FULL_50_13]